MPVLLLPFFLYKINVKIKLKLNVIKINTLIRIEVNIMLKLTKLLH
jgi:hypothetical protein